MKTLGIVVLTFLSYIGVITGIVWSLVSFIIYLVKDTPFMWGAVWLLCCSFVIMLVSLFIASAMSVRAKSKVNPFGTKKQRSRFQQRLDELNAQKR